MELRGHDLKTRREVNHELKKLNIFGQSKKSTKKTHPTWSFLLQIFRGFCWMFDGLLVKIPKDASFWGFGDSGSCDGFPCLTMNFQGVQGAIRSHRCHDSNPIAWRKNVWQNPQNAQKTCHDEKGLKTIRLYIHNTHSVVVDKWKSYISIKPKIAAPAPRPGLKSACLDSLTHCPSWLSRSTTKLVTSMFLELERPKRTQKVEWISPFWWKKTSFFHDFSWFLDASNSKQLVFCFSWIVAANCRVTTLVSSSAAFQRLTSMCDVDGRNPKANHLGCIKPCKEWDIYHINWLFGISSINSINHTICLDINGIDTNAFNTFNVSCINLASKWLRASIAYNVDRLPGGNKTNEEEKKGTKSRWNSSLKWGNCFSLKSPWVEKGAYELCLAANTAGLWTSFNEKR